MKKILVIFLYMVVFLISCQKEEFTEKAIIESSFVQINTWAEFKEILVENSEKTTTHPQGGPIIEIDSIETIGPKNEKILPRIWNNESIKPKLWLSEIPDIYPEKYGPVYEVATIFGKLRRVEIGDLHTKCGSYQQENQDAEIKIYKGKNFICQWKTTIQVQWKLGEPTEIGKVSIIKIFL